MSAFYRSPSPEYLFLHLARLSIPLLRSSMTLNKVKKDTKNF